MKNKGVTLIEVLISIAIIGGAIAVFGTLLSVLQLNKKGTLSTSAYKITQQELEALRNLSNSELTTRTNAGFLNVLYNNGTSTVITVVNAFSSPNILELQSPSSVDGRIILPTNPASNFTLEAQVYASAIVGQTGFIFRARDEENFYVFYIRNDKIILDKIVNNTISNLYQTFQTFNPDTWYKLKVSTSGNNILIYLNDTLLTTIIDNDLNFGYVGLFSGPENISRFDNISYEGFSWNFDTDQEDILPTEWQKFGLYDLPGGSGKITISEPYETSDLKKIDVTVSWVERGEAKSITISSLKTE